jgi:hypothetical protein
LPITLCVCVLTEEAHASAICPAASSSSRGAAAKWPESAGEKNSPSAKIKHLKIIIWLETVMTKREQNFTDRIAVKARACSGFAQYRNPPPLSMRIAAVCAAAARHP